MKYSRMTKKLSFSLLVLFICIGSVFSQQNSLPSENCIRCLCHARTGCFILRNCASYSISQDYWTQAGRPTVLDDDPNNAMSYTKCMQSDTCIMETIRGYIDSKIIKDCDCDNQMTCKDFAAIHLKGDQCQSSFDVVKLNRLDQCLSSTRGAGVSNNPGWNLGCTQPVAQGTANIEWLKILLVSRPLAHE